MSAIWEHLADGRWTPYDDSIQTELESGFKSGLKTVDVDNDRSVTFTNSAMHSADANKYYPVRRINLTAPHVPVCIIDGSGQTLELGRYTAMQILTWPETQPPWFRPQGEFYLTSKYQYLIDLVLMHQVNLETGERLGLVGPVKKRALQYRPPIIEGILKTWDSLCASQD